MESDDTQRNRTGDTERDHQEERRRPRRNPRLVFSDPDRFFRELLMEQQEQN